MAYTYNAQGNTTNYGDYNPAVEALQNQLNNQLRAQGKPLLVVDGKLGPKTQAAMNRGNHNQAVRDVISNDSRFQGMDINAIMNGYEINDFSGVMNASGQPIDSASANRALQESMSVLDPAYIQEKSKDTADTKANLALKKAEYQNYLDTSGAKFQEDKGTLDQTAANNGVLFSGGRIQKENNLATQYAQENALKKQQYSTDIGNTARDYQYKYGNDAANSSSLSNLYRLGGNTYNPNVSQGGVGSSGLSNVYSSGQYDFYGTNRAKQSMEAKQRAAGILWNKGNKLVSQNYKNQY